MAPVKVASSPLKAKAALHRANALLALGDYQAAKAAAQALEPEISARLGPKPVAACARVPPPPIFFWAPPPHMDVFFFVGRSFED